MTTTSPPACTAVRGTNTYRVNQGFDSFAAISTESPGSSAICLHLLTIPAGGRATPHLPKADETAIYVVPGEAKMWYGDNLADYLRVGARDFLYILAGVPHLPANPSESELCVAVIARTDPNEQESVMLRPNLTPGDAGEARHEATPPPPEPAGDAGGNRS